MNREKNIFHVNADVNLMVKNAIQNKNGIKVTNKSKCECKKNNKT